MYNALGAGKTVPHQFWLLSFSSYASLADFADHCDAIGASHGIQLLRRRDPCYALYFRFAGRINAAARLLVQFCDYVAGRNFNLFLYAHQAVLILRKRGDSAGLREPPLRRVGNDRLLRDEVRRRFGYCGPGGLAARHPGDQLPARKSEVAGIISPSKPVIVSR